MRYRNRFLALALWVAACLAFFHTFYQSAKEAALVDLNERQSIHARQAVVGVGAYFESWISLLASAAQRDPIIDLQETGKRQMEVILASHGRECRAITRVSKEGKIEHTVPFDPSLIGVDVSGQNHIRKIMRTARPVLSSVFTSVQGFRAVALHVPVFREGEYAGSLGVLLDFQTITKRFLEEISIGKTGYAWMIDRQGIELHCPVPDHVGKSVFENCRDFPSILAMAREMVQGKRGITTYAYDRIRHEKADPVLKHAVYMPVRIADTFWSVVVASSEDEVLESLHSLRNRLISVVALLFLGALFFSYSALKAWGVVREERKRQATEEELRQSEERAKRAAEVNWTIAQIGRIIGSTLKIEDIYEQFAQEVRKIIPFDRIAIGLINAQEGTYRFSYTSGMEIPAREEGNVVPLPGMIREVMRRRSGLLVLAEGEVDFSADYPEFLIPFRAGARSVMTAPLVHKDEVVGAIYFASREPMAYTEKDLKLAEDVAGQIAGAVANAQIHAQIRQAEEALRASEERFKAQYRSNPIPTFTWQRQGEDYVLVDCNDAADRMTAGRASTLLGFRASALYAERPAILQNLNRCFQKGETVRSEIWSRHFAPGKLVVVTDAFVPPDLVMAHLEDVTEQRRAEEEKQRLQEQLHQSQKMESVGRLAGGVAHDFNNMLGIIVGHAEIALAKAGPDDEHRPSLEGILKAANRSADLVRQLLAFARKQTVSPKILDLNDTVSSTLKMLRRLIGEDIELSFAPGHDLGPVKIDPSQVDQILANLAVNARDAIAGVGKVTIRTENVQFDEAYCERHPGSSPGPFVMLAVSDNGRGMGREIIEHLFEPFFTTKEVGKGTGLGLSTVYGIVKQNDGFISVQSEPGQGAVFRIYLPRVDAGKVETEGKSPGVMKGGTETVLLVEDEAEILEIGKAMLERLGYTVVTAGSPGEAMRIAEGHPGALHLLLTDIVMPEMNGRELADRLSGCHPGLKRLYMSGYTSNVIAHHGVLEEGVNFINKPFSMTELADKIREVLDEDKDRR